LSRVINLESAGKDRKRLTRATALALRELMLQTEITEKTRDLAPFIVLSLEKISKTIDPTVAAWEKRGYWVKADRFRMEWRWAEQFAAEMRSSLFNEDWAGVANVSAKISEKLNKEKVSERHRMGTPWIGAWKKIQVESK
jgi:hypothetical protein